MAPPASAAAAPTARSARRRMLVLAAGAVLAIVAVGGYWGWDWYRARGEWRAADEAIRRRDYPVAATHLHRYTQLRAGDSAGWFLAARTARRLGRFAEAQRHLEQCEKLGGETDSTRLERDLLEIQQGKVGEIDARIRSFVEPDHPEVLVVLEALARGYIASDRWAEARQACEMWRALQPDHPWAWLWSGTISERQGQLEQASEFYQRAMAAGPDDRDPRVAFARVLVRRRQSVAALEHYEWVLARWPNDVEALLGRAACLIDVGRADDAAPLLERVLARDPGSFAGLYLSGKAALERRDAAGAETWLRQAVRLEPGDPEALHTLILSLRAQAKDGEADRLARHHEELQRDLRRLGELMRTITPQLTDAAPCHEAGVIALRVGRIKEGVHLLHEALRRTGDHRATHAALATYYRRVGPAERAEFHQRLAELP